MTELRASSAPPPLQPPERLSPDVFELPVEHIRDGLYSDKYFLYARDVMLAEDDRSRVTMQVFAKKRCCLAGIDEAISTLVLCLTPGFSWNDLDVRALRDGDRVEPWETVMLINGPYAAFAHLETVYLGIIARRTKVATNTRKVVEAAWPRTIMYFPARHDHWSIQAGDGYAAHVAGAVGVSTDAQGAWWGGSGLGTVPHALIAAFDGDTVAAARAFVRHMPDVRLIPLVDFENDSVGTSLAVARALGPQLYGVRLDTSETMVDRSIIPMMGQFKRTGVNAQLVRNVRTALDDAGFPGVKIVASGGFDARKIQEFADEDVPVDSYGVGSSLLKDNYDFTADVVLREGQPVAKAGRRFRDNPRLQPVRLPI